MNSQNLRCNLFVLQNQLGCQLHNCSTAPKIIIEFDLIIPCQAGISATNLTGGIVQWRDVIGPSLKLPKT